MNWLVWSVALLLYASATPAAELVIYRSGPAREGNVLSCDEKGCRIDGRKANRDTIAAIVFDREATVDLKTTAAFRRTDEIRLRDGKLVFAAITEISRDEIVTASGEFARSDVTAIFFTQVKADAQPEILDDVLIMRGGERRGGRIELCSGGSCIVGTSSTPRDKIEWIGLARGDAAPPQSDRNTVHLVSGEVLDRELISIGEDVLTTFARYARKDVAWIHLARVADEQPPINRFPPTPPPAIVDPPPPPPPPARSSPLPARAPARGGLGPGDPCPAERPMGGYLELTESGPEVYSAPECLHRNESRMWFRLVPSPPVLPWPSRWTSSFYATSVHYRITMGPCTGPYYEGKCENKGGTARGDLDLAPSAGNGLINYMPFFGELSVSLTSAKAGVRTVTKCSAISASGNYSSAGESGSGASIGSLSITQGNCADRTNAFSFCSNITPCTETPSAADCVRQPHKFVVFPWEGSDRVNGTGPLINTTVRWKVCCGCGEPPEGGMDPIERTPKDPCDQIAALERRLRELQDARAQFARDLMAAQYRQKKVLLEKILSLDGTAAQTLIALVSLLSNATPLGKIGDAIGAFIDGYSLGRNPSSENIAAAIVGAASMDLPFDAIEKAAVTQALEIGEQYLKRTGDTAGALRQYERAIDGNAVLKAKGQKVVGALGVLVAAKGLYDNSKAFGDTLQDYFDAADDAKTNENGLDDADQQIREVLLELERLKRELEDPCATTSDGGHGSSFVLTSLEKTTDAPRLIRYQQGAPSQSGGMTRADVMKRLEDVRAATEAAEGELAAAAPYILLFSNAEARSSADPRLLVAMATEFRKRVLAAEIAVRRAATLAQRVVDDVKRQDSATATPGGDA